METLKAGCFLIDIKRKKIALVVWTPFEDVEKTLSYPSLKETWKAVKDKIEKVLNKKQVI